ncbi:MAG: hypothetical protein AB1443_13560 [Pseudomonadota bacterium]
MDRNGFIYDALPYLYTIGGVLTLLLSTETIGRISALLLISAAMLIFHLRLMYRSERATRAEMRLTATSKVLAETKRNLMKHTRTA